LSVGRRTAAGDQQRESVLVPGPLVDEIDVQPLDFGDELISILAPGGGREPPLASAESLAQLRVVFPPQRRSRGDLALGRFRRVQLGIDLVRMCLFVGSNNAVRW